MDGEYSLRARIAANRRWAFTADRTAATAAARAAADARFAREVDPDQVLPPDERERRAASLRKAHIDRMTLASIAKRKGRRRR
jgi:hypothetical protein